MKRDRKSSTAIPHKPTTSFYSKPIKKMPAEIYESDPDQPDEQDYNQIIPVVENKVSSKMFQV